MNFNYKMDNDTLMVSLMGRLDTEAAVKFEVELAEVCKDNAHSALIVDAAELEYVASSGLRTILKLAKTEKNFKIEIVSSSVYSVFEMTGFVDILNIE